MTYFITKHLPQDPEPKPTPPESSLYDLTIPLTMETIVHYSKLDSVVANSTLAIEIQEVMNDWKRFNNVNVTSIVNYDDIDNETNTGDKGSVSF